MQTATVPTERRWMKFASYYPPETKSTREDTLDLFAGFSMLKYNWVHFNKPWCPAWVRRDPTLAHQFAMAQSVLASSCNECDNSLGDELVVAYTMATADQPRPKRHKNGTSSGRTSAQHVEPGPSAGDVVEDARPGPSTGDETEDVSPSANEARPSSNAAG